MINLITKSLTIEIENFVSYCNRLCLTGNYELFTKSAFVQYRKKINPEVFKHLSNVLIDEFYTENDLSIKLWNGFRLLAVDGSRLTLPRTKELSSFYGETKNQNDIGVIQARVSVLYDVLNNYVIDGIISPLKVGESPVLLDTPNKIQQRIEYIHKNPVDAQIVFHERDYVNSSYRQYEDENEKVYVEIEPMY